MNSFYCEVCKEMHAEYCPKKSFFAYDSRDPEHVISLPNKIFDVLVRDGLVPQPKRKSFEFEGNLFINGYLITKIFGNPLDEFWFCVNDVDFYYTTKEAAEAARAELIRLNEELL